MDSAHGRKYVLLNVLSIGSAFLLAVIVLGFEHWYAEKEGFVDDLAIQASMLGTNASAVLAFDDERAGREMVSIVAPSPSVVEAALYRQDGTLLAAFRRPGENGLGAKAPAPAIVFTGRHVVVAQTVAIEGQPVGTIVLRATLDSVYRSQMNFLASLLLIAAVAMLVGHFASRRLRWRMAEAERRLEHMALYDNVTGLANRHAFELALEQTVRRHQRDGSGSALLFIDVDGFKKVNDMLGHNIGDRVLRGIGERLRATLRAADVIARIGGDEFGAILVDAVSPGAAARIATNLIGAMAQPFSPGGTPVYVGLSIGIAMVPQDGTAAEDLLHHADLAMYHAKQMGKGNHQFFSDEIGDMVRRRLDIEADLRQAIAHGELYVVYQPQVATATGAIAGLEALVRWRHASRGIILPGEFIPVAEESGLIMEVGRVVLAQVCRDIAELRGQGLRVPVVAVNVSARQFMQGDVAAETAAALRDNGLRPADVEIELTESMLMERLEDRRAALAGLVDSGIRIAIDDFGTGYSSLNYLKRLPVDKLKIDMSFVRDLPDNAESVAIVVGIVGMAHAIGLRVVAEGVETQAQRDCLSACGCDLLQGYLTGRPMEKAALVALLRDAP
ncbi:MAG: EAL domain-containing protein [Rhodocyclaceae bacterium]|nr:EAL domain-containing protein [Rhodocyclaceae bacterium]